MAPAEGELLAAAAWRRRRVLGEPVAAYGQRILGEPHLEGVLPPAKPNPRTYSLDAPAVPSSKP